MNSFNIDFISLVKMQKRKVTIDVDIDDEKVNCIEDLECEILAQNIHKQVACKYLESLQDGYQIEKKIGWSPKYQRCFRAKFGIWVRIILSKPRCIIFGVNNIQKGIEEESSVMGG